MAHAAHGVAEEVLRHVDADAGAIAGLAVGVDGAAMADGLQRADRHLDDLAARRAVDLRDEADAARILLVGGVVGIGLDQRVALGGVVASQRWPSASMRHQNVSSPVAVRVGKVAVEGGLEIRGPGELTP